MTVGQARRWIGVYFLTVTAATGGYLLLFNESPMLPLAADDAAASFQIIIPVLIGQLTIVFQWIAGATRADLTDSEPCPIPTWAIKLPPLIAVGIITVAVIMLLISNMENVNLSASPSSFKNAVTFAASVLNASTVLLVARLFPSKVPR